MNAQSEPSRPVLVRGLAAGFAQTIAVGPHNLKSDEPVGRGGVDHQHVLVETESAVGNALGGLSRGGSSRPSSISSFNSFVAG